MKKLLAAALGLSLLVGCAAQPSPSPLSPASPVSLQARQSPRADEALADLGLELVRDTRGEKGTLVSPLSVLLALAMAANGAQGETLSQLETMLAGGGSLEELNATCAWWMEAYSNLGGSTRSSIANSLWADPQGQVGEDFTGTCQGVFGAQLFQVELSDPALVGQVNGWVRERTGEMIPSILDRPLTRDAAALLVNALYLENTWLYEFDPQNTQKGTFAHGDGTAGEMEFLVVQACRRTYLSTEDAQGVVLPYDDGRLGFFALMPREGLSLEDWLTGQTAPTGGDLIRLLAEAEEAQFFTLRLPKFEAEWAGELKEALTGLGIGLAFDPERADFSRLGDHPQGYFLGEVHHAAKIAVHEKGSKAAAATAVIMYAGGAPDPEGISLVFDRPFLYGIVDLEGGVPLFLGTFE